MIALLTLMLEIKVAAVLNPEIWTIDDTGVVGAVHF
jgi:hypothetical protein